MGNKLRGGHRRRGGTGPGRTVTPCVHQMRTVAMRGASSAAPTARRPSDVVVSDVVPNMAVLLPPSILHPSHAIHHYLHPSSHRRREGWLRAVAGERLRLLRSEARGGGRKLADGSWHPSVASVGMVRRVRLRFSVTQTRGSRAWDRLRGSATRGGSARSCWKHVDEVDCATPGPDARLQRRA
jgi:hypothetical protein